MRTFRFDTELFGTILNSGHRPLALRVKDKDVRNKIAGSDFERAQHGPQGEGRESPSNPSIRWLPSYIFYPGPLFIWRSSQDLVRTLRFDTELFGIILNSGHRPLALRVKDMYVRNENVRSDFERAQGESMESPSNSCLSTN